MTSNESPINISTTHNQLEYSVSGLSQALKTTVETTFGHVRIRGEISGCKRAASGHIYMDLKDDKAVLNSVCWRGVASKLTVQPDNGLDVICTGRLSTYPGRSNYQLIIERMELAGVGALMALLEKRKKAMAAEGLFDADRKQALPFLPQHVGVITSPTGAVIRDILHRISDRFPCHVMIWPVLVQGKEADIMIADAIKGFNRFDGITTPPRPDVLIVARGGGSMEDLWCFNEEAPVRAAAASDIPLISAVGHETDTTLIDYVSSKRAPTPTAAAEIAVPVRHELWKTISTSGEQLGQCVIRHISQCQQQLDGMSRGLVNPQKSLELNMQRLDEWAERLARVIKQQLGQREQQLSHMATAISSTILQQRSIGFFQTLEQFNTRLHHATQQLISRKNARYIMIGERITPHTLLRAIANHVRIVTTYQESLGRCITVSLHQADQMLASRSRMLEALNNDALLQRGYAYITHDGHVLQSVNDIPSSPVKLHMHDGVISMARHNDTPRNTAKKNKKKTTTNTESDMPQQQLL